jgi:hypothetical protein
MESMGQKRQLCPALPLGHSRPFRAIAFGGFVVGVLDLAYAIVVYSPTQPILIPQTIASGILGHKSYDGGAQTAILGIVLHFIAFGAATVYYLASRKLSFLISHAVYRLLCSFATIRKATFEKQHVAAPKRQNSGPEIATQQAVALP